jgi:hypothetical protein
MLRIRAVLGHVQTVHMLRLVIVQVASLVIKCPTQQICLCGSELMGKKRIR